MPSRLPWRGVDDRPAYIAYPLGDALPQCFAMVWPEAGLGHGGWRWLARVAHPDASRSFDPAAVALRNGTAPSDAEAAAAATSAWPEVLEEGRSKGLLPPT